MTAGAFRLLALVAGPFAFLFVSLFPLPGLTPPAHTLAAILACVLIYWVCEPVPLPVTALLGTAACVVAGLGSAKTVFAAYAHPIVFLFIGSFILAEGLAVHGVDRRIACWMLSLRWVGGRPSRMLLVIGATTAFISMWISNTAATAMMLPVALGILGTLHDAGTEATGRFRIGLLLMLSYAATAGGVATLIGTPPNLIGAGLISQHTGRGLSFLDWMGFGLPLALLLLAAAWGVLHALHPSTVARIPGLDDSVARQRRELGAWTRGQINAAVAFLTAVILWVGPGLAGGLLGNEHPVVAWLDARLPNEMVALFAAGLLFVLPLEWRTATPTLTWKQAAAINWGVIVLFAGGLAFGELMVQTKLSAAVGEGFLAVFGAGSVWTLTAVAIGTAVLISEFTSNTAAASLLVPLAIAVAQAGNVSPVPPALGAALGASWGFALPISTGPNAIVYGTNLIPMRSMIVAGVVYDCVGATIIWLGLRLLCPALGLG